ncbi:hypothetical protein OG897_39545 [Streptomyces sp. NBC_00237]|uniref:hypothetical protein n=1 Tax=Streptomyces sp. NBC_00237 TaxID=2975687 RepID=UPI002259557A|nr:hypothetical protein [Streptomyces sp. NBC_00237]MCX5207485.1 hypothetical protein [Streptomyces sp. NBC_00237]
MRQEDVERLHAESRVHPVHAPEADGAGEVPMITLGGVQVSVYVVLDPDGEARMRLSVDLDEASPDLLNSAGVLPAELLMGGQRVWWGS